MSHRVVTFFRFFFFKMQQAELSLVAKSVTYQLVLERALGVGRFPET